MQKIYINGRFLTQKLTGVNRFAYEICLALAAKGVDFQIIAPKNINKNYDVSKFKMCFAGHGNSHFWEQTILPFYFLFKKKYILINFSGLGSIFLKKQFITIHDLSFLKNPQWFSKKYYYFYKILTPIVAKKALQILTVSHFSKKEIIKYLNINEDKISVIYNAVSEKFNNNPPLSEKKSYILAVSSIEPRKNFERLLAAAKLLDDNIKLLVVGSTNKVFGNVDLEHNNRVDFLGYVNDDDLKKYYSEALLFVYPSIYEGFGLPPLEAMALGCPVVLSDIEVFHEVFGEAAIYFNPYDIDDIAQKINGVLKSKETQKKLILQGYDLVKKYDYEKSANLILSQIILIP